MLASLRCHRDEVGSEVGAASPHPRNARFRRCLPSLRSPPDASSVPIVVEFILASIPDLLATSLRSFI